MKLTQDRLKELIDYNPETGIFLWKVDRTNKTKKGMFAGRLNKKSGYWQIGIDSNNYYAHRLAFLFIDGYLPENGLDHIDRDKLNNKWNNLRETSTICNMRNRNIFKNNKSGITGIHWHKSTNKWYSKITALGKQICLGVFDNLIDAARARWEAEIKYNFPNCNTTSSAYMYLKKNNAI